MTTEPVDYETPDTRQRITECPYCGVQIERGPGGALVAHLPCDATPTTDEVVEAQHGD